MHDKIPHMGITKIIRWPVAVLVLHTFATVSGLYWQISRLDNVLHFLGGMSIAAASIHFLFLAERRKYIAIHNWFIQIFIIIAVVALAAVTWESMEYVIDHAIASQMQGDLTDTMSDIALALCGGGIVGIINKSKKN